ncbi:MAG: hypothetical protein Kow0075_11430 [Salibacteraceae bacterium]
MEIPDNSFVQATVNALNEIAESQQVSQILQFLVETEEYNINIKEHFETTSYTSSSFYKDKNGDKVIILSKDQDVLFNPNQGL